MMNIKVLCLLSVGAAVLYPDVLAFAPVVRNDSPGHRISFDQHTFQTHENIYGGKKRSICLGAELTSSEKDDLLATIRSMRVKELKAELENRKISTADAFEKEELVKRLYDARITSPSPPKAASAAAAAAATAATTTTASNTASTPNTDTNVIRGKLSCVTLDSGRSIEGTYNSESIRLENNDIEPYPSMAIQVIDNKGGFPLKLLVDTACSGLLLTPSAVRKNNMQTISAPVSTTGAGGTSSGGGVTQIDRFTFDNNKEIMGPLPAVVQDTGVLEPLGLDGIIGISFLGKYACTEIDLERSEIALYKTDYRPPYDESDLEVVAEGEMSPTRLGIWTVDTTFDLGGGKQGTPIKMLVDTGSTSTILSWKGLQDGLGLSRSSPEVQMQEQTGAMGLDSMAMSLTHKIEVGQPIQFGRPRGRSPPTHDGLSIGEGQTATVDIGEIAVVDTQLAADNVGGILGMNVLSKASMIRMVFSEPIPRVTLFQKKSRGSSSENTSATSVSGIEEKTTETTTSSDVNPSPATTQTFEVEPEFKVDIPSPTPTSAPEETKPRKKKKKRRY